MQHDIRPWYHLIYVTDQIKSADQKAYIAVGVLCMVVGFTNQSIAKVIAYMTHANVHSSTFALVVTLVVVCLAGFVATISEFYRIIFPKVNNARYIKNKERSAIFWNDVASMPFDTFKAQYMESDREDDLVVQIYVLSQIAQLKFRRTGRLFTYAIFTTAFVFVLFLYAKSL